MATKKLSLKVNACLFDVDGTIIISQPAIAAFWRDFGKDKPYFDTEHVVNISHGCRTYDIMAKYAPDYATEEYVNKLESTIPEKYGEYSVEVPGAVKLCNSFNELPKEKWAVATSGTRDLATKWFKYLHIKKPTHFITANDVTQGKPHPEPYLKGRTGLGYPPNKEHPELSKVVVFEDAPAGIIAGKAANCKIIGIASTFDLEFLKEKGCDIVVKNLESVSIGGYDSKTDEVELVFSDYLYVKDDIQQWK
ncbi:probable (DL)-glycerol-3-phosphatase 2 [Saccharomycodes ludwigii]|uniref:glycerol-1-phosphatase n=1 Tax=Saccharomycodes ludwigii TaxID=36035 RepID=A0A376BBM5_9ASCO|nr:hypothetical protein SCDLUD_003108 [Saccharomycodes ludwigii]KAH3900139.1 hypothetical protein SCDLUD_003108 [Saccharomycodes ludwigii]SSD62027.1 probable (DL)-glycerol-3-phosphatase 2 [Saccharomycodes ludwigii]